MIRLVWGVVTMLVAILVTCVSMSDCFAQDASQAINLSEKQRQIWLASVKEKIAQGEAEWKTTVDLFTKSRSGGYEAEKAFHNRTNLDLQMLGTGGWSSKGKAMPGDPNAKYYVFREKPEDGEAGGNWHMIGRSRERRMVTENNPEAIFSSKTIPTNDAEKAAYVADLISGVRKLPKNPDRPAK